MPVVFLTLLLHTVKALVSGIVTAAFPFFYLSATGNQNHHFCLLSVVVQDAPIVAKHQESPSLVITN